MTRILMRGEFFNGRLTLPDDVFVEKASNRLMWQKDNRVPLHHQIITVVDDKDVEVFLSGAKFGSNGNVMWVKDELVPLILDRLEEPTKGRDV